MNALSSTLCLCVYVCVCVRALLIIWSCCSFFPLLFRCDMRFSVARKRQPLWQLRRNIWCALLLFSSLNSTLRASAISSTDTLTYPNACQRNLCFLCMRVGVCVAGDQCTYKECDTGFELSDSGTAGARECELVGSSGRWSGSARTCDGEMRTILGGGATWTQTHTHTHTYIHTHTQTHMHGHKQRMHVFTPAARSQLATLKISTSVS